METVCCHMLDVSSHFEFESFGEYMEMYMEVDVISLQCVVEKFRTVVAKNYSNLDPMRYKKCFLFNCLSSFDNIGILLLHFYNLLIICYSNLSGIFHSLRFHGMLCWRELKSNLNCCPKKNLTFISQLRTVFVVELQPCRNAKPKSLTTLIRFYI